MSEVDVFSWEGGYEFKTIEGVFDDYISQWRKVKEESTGGLRLIAKLMLNSLYGKFGTNPDVTPKIPIFENGIVEYVLSEEPRTRDPIYVAVACYVTAYSRKALIDAIMRNKNRFIYCDTDSIHLTGTRKPLGIRIHDTDFCAWKVEGTFRKARHLRAKSYIWDFQKSGKDEYKIEVTCAGMPENVKQICTFDNFHYGFNNLDEHGKVLIGRGKLTPVGVPGGVVLEPRPFELR
jgi:hypothetical protein